MLGAKLNQGHQFDVKRCQDINMFLTFLMFQQLSRVSKRIFVQPSEQPGRLKLSQPLLSLGID